MYNSRSCRKISWSTWQRFHRQPAPCLALVKLKCGYFKHSYWTQRPNYHPKLLIAKAQYGNSSRGYAMLVGRLVKGVLKIRYLVLGGALSGGYTLQKKYDEWKEALPDMKWIESIMPNQEQIDNIKVSMADLKKKMKNFEIDPRLQAVGEKQLGSMKEWFDKRLDEAYSAAEERDKEKNSLGEKSMWHQVEKFVAGAKLEGSNLYAMSTDKSWEELKKHSDEKLDNLEKQLIDMQKEMLRLEKDNKDLRQRLLLRQDSSQTHRVQVIWSTTEQL